MKKICSIALLLVALSVVGALAFTWTATLPSASTSTLGENMKREEMKAALQETRDNMDTLQAGDTTFATYTAAIGTKLAAMTFSDYTSTGNGRLTNDAFTNWTSARE